MFMPKIMQAIPCLVFFLEKYGLDTLKKIVFNAIIGTEEGFKFGVEVANTNEKTFFHGKIWKEFARVYHFNVGLELVFSMDTPGPEIAVVSTHFLITHPSMFFFSLSSFNYFHRSCPINSEGKFIFLIIFISI
jgi:hypothetical protein